MLEDIKNAVSDFTKVQIENARLGAEDQSTDTIFQEILLKTIKKEPVEIPENAYDWGLFDDYGSEIVARELYLAVKKIIDLLNNMPFTHSKRIINYINDICWRFH